MRALQNAITRVWLPRIAIGIGSLVLVWGVLVVIVHSSFEHSATVRPSDLSTVRASSGSGQGATAASAASDDGLEVTKDGNFTTLAWPHVDDATYYTAQRSPGPAFTVIGITRHAFGDTNDEPLALPSFTERAISPEIFHVNAYNAAGKVIRSFSLNFCGKFGLLAARGSGQNFPDPSYADGAGDRGKAVFEALRRDLGVSRFDAPALAIDYPAISVTPESGVIAPGMFSANYDKSVKAGTNDVLIKIRRLAYVCPRIKLVMFGFSQGAEVMGNAFTLLSSAQRRMVSVLILFADAKLNPRDPQVNYLPHSLPDGGIKGARARFPPSAATSIDAWCWSEDAICQRSTSSHHFHGSIYDTYEPLAAQRAAKALAT